MAKFIILIVIISISAACGFFIGQQTKSSASSETLILEDTKKPDFIKVLENEMIRNFQSWENTEGKKSFAVIRQLNEPCDKDYGLSSCEKFSVYDETGKVLYELKDFGINSIDSSRFKPNSNQLIIETNGGGTDEFLKIVDYKDGKFVELDASLEIQLRGGWWTMPEYRSGITGAYFKPSQLIVIQQIGGADDRPKASVFRFRENKFQKVGEISMQKLGDSIEKQLTEQK